jgi:ribosomal protein L21E
MMAAALTRQEIFSMSLRLPEEKKRVAHWDTEQNRYDYHAMIKLVCKLGNIDAIPDHFHSFHCRQDNAATIIAMVKYFLSIYPDTGLLFLDGLLDMIDRFNDEGQSKMLVNFLKQITDQYNVLVIGVLHRGVTHDKSLGHVGSIADRAAQSVLIVEKNKEAKQYVLKPEYLRSADDFEPVAIYYNKQLNLWEQTEYMQPDQPAERQRKKRPAEYDYNDHAANVARIFRVQQSLPYKQYIQEICEVYALGYNLAKDMGSYLVREGLIWKTQDGYTNIRQSKLFVETIK